jgi:hypothetical protein
VLRPPMAVGAAASRAEVHAEFGVSADTLRALNQNLERQIDRWLPPAEREEAKRMLLEPISGVAFEQLGASAYHEAPRTWLTGVQRLWLRGERTALLASLDSLATDNLVNAKSAFHGARLALRIGDSTRAAAALDHFIAGLPSAGDNLFSDAPEAAPITRILALRAELARRTDPARARQLAAAVLALWRSPDPELAGVVARMREMQQD